MLALKWSLFLQGLGRLAGEGVRSAEAAERAASQGAALFEHRALTALVEGGHGDAGDAARLATLARRLDARVSAGRL